jgi:hypothetical protein
MLRKVFEECAMLDPIEPSHEASALKILEKSTKALDRENKYVSRDCDDQA